jgi:hypothetical protein
MLKSLARRIQLIAVVAALTLVNVAYMPKAFAAFVGSPSVMLTNMNASGAGPVILRFTTSASNTGTTLTLSFPTFTGTTNGFVNATQTVAQNYNGASCTAITGASAFLPGTPTASGNAGTGLITFAGITAYTASTSYCAVLTSATAVTNPSATGSYSAVITAGSDSATSAAVDVITNDQVVVNATVPASFTLALSANTDNFSPLALSTGSVGATTGITATINTNAFNGWFLWASDATTGLRSPTQSFTIPSNPTIGITQGSGSGTTSAFGGYASSGAANGSGLDTVPRKIATSTGTANGAIVTVKEYAAISGTTPAATDYADTITIVGAGSF